MKKKILIILIVLIALALGGFFLKGRPFGWKKFSVPGTPLPVVVKGFSDAHAHLFDVGYIDYLIEAMDKNGVEKTVRSKYRFL